MAYKTILVHLDKKEKALNRIRIAGNLAKTENAYLVGAAMIGLSTLTFREAHIDEKDPALASHLKFLAERARGFVGDFVHEMQSMGVLSYEGRVVDDEAGYGISMQARYSDLVVIGRSSPDETMPHAPKAFPEFVVLHAGRPVLLVPSRYEKETVGSKVLIAWNASKEVRRAVSDAMPFLKRADVVEVVMFNVDAESDMRDEGSVTDLAVYLARHGVNVNILQPRRTRHIGSALMDVVAERQSDLLVLGGYGQTRFREFLLGGVTRTVLSDAVVPVLMSH
ncbi:MAG: universal stress protein [Alistipes senegalensis]|nr:universal stress protein [Oxalobacter formigenes]MCM1280818.1 universal stress protein [Alistipes senegalensis]